MRLRAFVGNLALLGLGVSASATNLGTVIATPTTVFPNEIVTASLNGGPTNTFYAGLIHWNRLGGTFDPNQLGPLHFESYCIEFSQDVTLLANPPYTFTVNNNLAEAPDPGGVFGLGATGMGTAKAGLITELWANHYAESATDPVKSAAFQLALWEIIYDYSGNIASLDIGGGNFKLINAWADELAIRNTSAVWLGSLTGVAPQDGPVIGALTSPEFQDQGFLLPRSPEIPVPVPSAVWSGAALLATVMVVHLRRRMNKPQA